MYLVKAGLEPFVSFLQMWKGITILKKWTRFLASAVVYIRTAFLYSTLHNITVERRPQKSTARLRRCGIVTFSLNRVISILKKMYGVVLAI